MDFNKKAFWIILVLILFAIAIFMSLKETGIEQFL